MEWEYLEFTGELFGVDFEADWAACIPDANLAIACCVRDDLENGDEDADDKEESLLFSPATLCGNVWLRVDADARLHVLDDSPLTEARNGKAVAALKALALPGI